MVSMRASSCVGKREVAKHERSVRIERGDSNFPSVSINRLTQANQEPVAS